MIAQPGVWTGTKFQEAVGIKEIELCPWTVLSRAEVAKRARGFENNIVRVSNTALDVGNT